MRLRISASGYFAGILVLALMLIIYFQQPSAEISKMIKTANQEVDYATRRTETIRKPASQAALPNPLSSIAPTKKILGSRLSHIVKVQQKSNLKSVQVQQTFDGEPLSPVGRLVIDYDNKGREVGKYSTLVKDLEISNRKQINTSQANRQIEDQLRRKGLDKIPERFFNGRNVIWIDGPGQGKYAREYFAAGQHIVVDMEDGKIIYDRDRRQF
jgi:hypothetical protein